ncbi:ABC transporter substrate-binding protein [Bradyrhizobium sp. USDA 4486]
MLAALFSVTKKDAPPLAIPDAMQANLEHYAVKWNASINYSAVGVTFGIERGFFDRAGLTLAVQDGTSDADTAASVAGDDHMIGQVSASGFLRARSAGLDVVAFAASYIVNSTEIYTLRLTKIESPGDLSGKAIAYDPAADSNSIFDALVRRNGIPRSGLIIVETQELASRLIRGDVDVIVGKWEKDGLDLKESGIRFQAVSPDAFGIHSLGSVYIASSKLITGHPEVLEHFLVGLFAAWDAAYQDYGQLAAMSDRRAFGNADVARIGEAMDRQRQFLRPLGTRMGELDATRLREMQNLLLTQRAMVKALDLYAAANFTLVREIYRQRLKALEKNYDGRTGRAN